MVTSSLYRKHNGFFLFKMWMYFFILGLFIQPGYTGIYTCPSKCACVDTIHNSVKGYNVNCSGVNLTSIPSTGDKDANQVFRLYLSKNLISVVASADFQYFTALLELDLSFNFLSSITAGVFDGLTNLQILNLQGNGISSFSSKTFGIKSLISLNLAYNNFTVLNKDFLAEDSLQYLNISNLQLTSIPSTIMTSHDGLVSVDLSYNQITSIPKSSFSNKNLQYINLAGNSLTQLGDDVFFHEKSRQITEVDFSQNQISSISTDAFISLYSATTLNLSRNKLTIIPPNLFSAVSNLQTLYLDNNFLSSLDSSVFTSLSLLEKLYLQNNNLTTLVNGTFSKQTSLTTINLSGNPWVCDKNLYWLKAYLTSKTTLTIGSANNTLCTDSVGNTAPLLETGDYFWRPEDIYSCYDDEFTGDNQVILFSKSSFKIPATECQKYCFEQDLRFSLYESMVCLCGNVGTRAGCYCPSSSGCSLTQISGVQHVTAGIAIQPVPTLTVGVAFQFNATTTLASVNNFIWSFGDSSLTYTVTASGSTARSHTYIRPGNYTVMLMACYGTSICDTGTVPIIVQVANSSLVTYLTYGRTARDVSQKLDVTSTFLQGYDFQYTWSRTDSKGTLTTVKTCPSGWSAYRYKCLKLKTSAKDFTSASSDCRSDDATLISLDFGTEVADVLSLFSLNGSSYNVLTNGMKVAGIYQWISSGQKTYFSNSDLVDSTSGDCIIIQASTKKITTTPCTTAHTYICQKDPVACPYGGSVYNNDQCFVVNNLSANWNTARSTCESSYPNGELAIINSADVQNLVAGLLASAAINEAWIGLSDRILEGYKVWVDGTGFDPSSDFNLMSGSGSYDCVVTNKTAWLSVNCNSGRGYVCQYNLNNRTTVSTYIAGRYDLDIPEGQSLISLSEASVFTGSATSTVYIFPGLWFSRPGTIRGWNFHAKPLSASAKVVLQVYRPICTSNYVIQPACIPGIAYSSCSVSSSSALKCQTLVSPDDKNPCYLTNTSLPYYEICNCRTRSYTCGTGTIPTYHLLGQTMVNLDAGPEQTYTLSSDIAVKELDVLGFQFESSSNPIKCTGSGATDDDLYVVSLASWLTKGYDVTVSSKQSMTCYFQAVYSLSQESDIPSNLAYFSSVGQYTVQIELPESKDKKSFTIDLIEPVASVVWVYPAKLEPAATIGSEGTVYVEYGTVYNLTVRAGMGSSLSSIWSLDTSTPVSFSSSCPTSVASAVVEDCNTTLYWSNTPFSSMLYRFDVGDMTSLITVNISNSVSYKIISVNLVKLVPLTSINLNHTGPSNPMRVGEYGSFGVYGVLGDVDHYYYAVNGTNVSGFSGTSMQYLFSSAGTYNVSVMAVNKLGSTLGAWKSVDVKPAAGFTNLKFTTTSFLAAVSKNYMLSISVGVSIGAEVTVGWNFGDASINTSVTIITSSSTLYTSENNTYFSVGIYTATMTVKDAFEEQSLSVNITVCSAIPASASVAASVNEFVVGSSINFAVTVPLSPGPYCDITYTWDFNDGSSSSGPTNDSSRAKIFTSARSYNVTVLISNTVSQQTVFVNVTAIEKVQGLELVYDGPTLLTQPTVFTLTTTAGTNMLYNFYCSLFNDTVASLTYSYTFPNKGKYDVTVVAYNVFSSTSQTITVYVIDNITLELTVDTPTACFATKESQNFKVDALHYKPSLLTFNWSFGDGTSSNMKNYNKSYTLPGQKTVTLMVSDGTTTASESRSVCVIEKIVGAKISNNGPIGLSSGGVALATATVVTTEGSNLTYLWTLGSSMHSITNNSFTVVVSLPGIFQVNATVFNILSSTSLSTDIQVQTFISGLAIMCQQCIYNSAKGLYYIGKNSTVTFIASVTAGDNVTYIWDLGGGNSGLFGSAQTTAYSVEATYTVTVNASNSVGSSFESINVTVESIINQVTIHPSTALSATNTPITFNAIVTPSGILIKSYEWIPCNSCIAQNGTSSITFNYTSKGYQTCKVTASNDISSVSANTTIRIMEKIEYLIIKANLTNINYAPFNVSVYFYAELNTEDDLNYSWVIRKENALVQIKYTKDTVYVFDSLSVKYYTVVARFSNFVSTSSSTVTIYIEERIDGLVLTSNVSSAVITPDMSLLLTANVTSGNNINYTWSQNVSGVTSVFSSGRNGTSVWTPSGSGKYNLTITATNNINTEEGSKFVEVQEVISGVNMTCTWPTAREKPYIATSETLICTATVVMGDNVQYYWNVSHDIILDYSIISQTLNYTFLNQCVYNVTLKIKNLVSEETTSMLVFVENEIPAFTLNADVNPAKTGQMVTFTTSLMDLLYIKFNWTIDGGALIFNDNGTIPSTFTAGMHSINVTAFNNISTRSADLRLLVQDPIRNLTVGNCAKRQNTEHPFTLIAIFDAGTNISFVWTLSISATSTEIVYGTTLTHTFTEAGNYSVQVNGSNLVSSDTYHCVIPVIGMISNVTVHLSTYLFTNYTITFTLTGTNLENSNYLWSFSNGENVTTTAPSLDKIFTVKRNYTLTVVVYNDINSVSKVILFSLEELRCVQPYAQIVGRDSRTTLRSRTVEFEVSVDNRDCIHYTATNQWKIYKNVCNSTVLGSAVTLDSKVITSTPQFTIPVSTLNYGTYCVIFTVSYTDTPLTASVNFSLNIVDSALQALLVSGSESLYPAGTAFMLNASTSYDPDNVASTVMTYNWTCSRTNPSASTSDMCTYVSGRSSATISIPAGSTVLGQNYIISVTVSATGRISSTATQIILIGPPAVPFVVVTCISCQATSNYKISKTSQISLLGHCTNCQSGVTTTYLWTVVTTAGVAVGLSPGDTTTGLQSNNLVIKSGVLDDGTAYKFMLTVTLSGQTGYSSITLDSNTPPSGGTCILETPTITYLEQRSNISCTGWKDSDSMSEVYYKVVVRRTISATAVEEYLVYYGTQENTSLYISPWPDTGDAAVNIIVYVKDDLEASKEAYSWLLNFRSPSLRPGQTKLDYLVDSMKTQLLDIVNQNNPSLLVQYVISTLMVLNDLSASAGASDTNLTTRAAIRDLVTVAITGLPIDSVSEIQQLAFALKLLTDFETEILTDEYQNLIMNTVSHLIEILNSKVSQGMDQDDFDPDNLLGVITNTVEAINLSPNVITMSNTTAVFGDHFQYRPSISDILSSTTSDPKQLVADGFESGEKLVGIALTTKLVGEDPVNVVMSNGVTFKGQRVLKENIWTAPQNQGSLFSCGVNVLDGKISDKEELFQIVFEASKNQFDWEYIGNHVINSRVASMSFKYTNSSDIPISNLDEASEVKIYMFGSKANIYPITNGSIINSTGYNPTEGYTFTTSTLDAGASKLVNLNVKNASSGVALHISVQISFYPTTAEEKAGNKTIQSGTLNVYLGINKKETKSSDYTPGYFKRITMDMMTKQYDHRAYTFFIPASTFNPSDKYSLGIYNMEPDKKVNVSIGMLFTSCQYFNTHTLSWDMGGCTPLEESIPTVTSCSCNHMTSYGGSFLMPLDAIDFADFAKLDLAANPIAVITCSVLLFLYIVMVILCALLDRMDMKRISMVPLCGKDGSFKYEITVITGRQAGAGTTAHVGVRICGEYGKTKPQHLQKTGAFQRNCQDKFIIAHDVNLGDISKVSVWHDNNGKSPSWYLAQIIVKDLQTDKKYYFFAGFWLSLEMEGGIIQKDLKVADSSERHRFTRMFSAATSNSLADKHLWLSLFNRPAHSRFTRVQRATCLVTLLYTFMCVNAIWYGIVKQKTDPNDLSSFGWEEVVVGLVSNIVMFPITYCLILLFRKSRSKSSLFDHGIKPMTAQTIEIDNMCDASQVGDSFRGEQLIPYDLERESTVDSYDIPPTSSLHRTRAGKIKREGTDDSLTSSTGAGARTKHQTLPRSKPMWSHDAILKWPEKMPSFIEDPDSRPSTGATITDVPTTSTTTTINVKQPPAKAGGASNGTRKTEGKSGSEDLLSYLDQMETELRDKEYKASVKRTGSTKQPVSVRRVSADKSSHWGSLEDILNSDDESTSGSSNKRLKKRESRSTLSSPASKPNTNQSQRNFNPREEPTINQERNGQSRWPVSRQSVTTISSANGDSLFYRDNTGQSFSGALKPGYVSRFNMEEPVLYHKPKNGCTLPHWCVYLAYVLCFLLSVVSIALVILYCYNFGYDRAVEWVLAFIFALLLSVFLFEPLKAMCFALYMALCSKKVELDEEEDIIDIEPSLDNTNEKFKEIRFRPLAGYALLQAKEEGRKVCRMKVMMRQCFAYIFYLWLLLVITYIHLKYDGYLQTKSIEYDFITATSPDYVSFRNISSINEFWDWTENVFTRGLHLQDSNTLEEHGELLGTARMRQIRGVGMTCQAKSVAESLGARMLTNRICHGTSSYDENTKSYGESWNESSQNLSWMYSSAAQLGSGNKLGFLGTYGGGGYVQTLGTSEAETASVVANLRSKGWLDLSTRAVVLEFTKFSAGTEMTALVSFLVEFQLTGRIVTSYETLSHHLLWFQQGQVDPLLVCEVILLLVVIYTLVHLSLSIRDQKKKFFMDFWNWYEMLTTLLCILSIGLYVGSVVEATNAFQSYFNNKNGFTNFERTIYVHTAMKYVQAWLLFLLILKVVKQMRFIKFLHVYELTLSRSVGKLMGVAVIFAVLLTAYAMLGNLMYGKVIEGFQSVGHTMVSLVESIRGTFDFWPLLDYHPIFSHFYFYSFYAFVYGITTALIIAILNDMYSVIRSQMLCKVTLEMHDYEMIDFVLNRFKLWSGIKKPKPAFRKVRFQGLPSASSRASSSYSNRPVSSSSSSSLSTPEYSRAQLDSMMLRVGPTWQMVLKRFERIESLDKEEEKLLKSTENGLKDWKFRQKISNLEKEGHKLLETKPPLDSRLRQSVPQRKALAGNKADRRAPASVSTSRVAATPPSQKAEESNSRRPLSDQGARDFITPRPGAETPAPDPSTLKSFLKILKPSKAAWNK